MILLEFGKKIEGTSVVKKYEKWIEFSSYSLNTARHIQVQGNDRDQGQAYVSELLLTKGADQTSPNLFIESISGSSLEKATLVVLHPAGSGKEQQLLLTLTMEHPIVSSFSTQCTAGGRPEEHISLNFTKITYKYEAFDGGKGKGNAEKDYDLVTRL